MVEVNETSIKNATTHLDLRWVSSFILAQRPHIDTKTSKDVKELGVGMRLSEESRCPAERTQMSPRAGRWGE
jgi:hypothetical protein